MRLLITLGSILIGISLGSWAGYKEFDRENLVQIIIGLSLYIIAFLIYLL